MPELFNKLVQLVWVAARALVIAGYTGAFAVLSAVALPEMGLTSDWATVYAPGFLALLLAVGGVHYLFGPELGRLQRARAV
ncbi:MAG: hypothetical protein ACFE0P_07920 [Oceanicaulis sp.]